jgi:homoserine kinase type II
VRHLAGGGIVCPQPVPNRSGAPLGTLAGRPAAIVTFLEGMSVRRPDAKHCAMVGEALARLHGAGADFQGKRANALSLPGWQALLETTRTGADTVLPGLAGVLDAEMRLFSVGWPRDLPTGIIHADLFPDNVFFLGGRLSGLIDFYFACTDAFAYDLAICLNAWCFEPDASFNITKGMALLNGYEKVRVLSKPERDALPMLARGAALRFLLTRLYDSQNVPPGALVRPKDPLEYAKKLRFHQKVQSARDYGLMK